MALQQSNNARGVITHQPDVNNPQGFVPCPPILKGGYQPTNTTCPTGLEYLMPLDQVFLDQRVEPFEVMTGAHCSNRYTIVNGRGEPLYVVREESSWLMRAFAGAARSFKMSICDSQGREAILIKRPVSFIADRVEVYNKNTLLGSIEKVVFTCAPEFRILDDKGIEILSICGPLCLCGWESEFSVRGNNGNEIGMVRKHWSGLARELFTRADVFGVTFPVDLSVRAKAILLAAAILIDFGYFER